MAASTAYRILFVLYCVEAGAFLLLAPWSPAWDRQVIQIPIAALRDLCLHPAFRGAVTGFGLVHLIWGIHDFDLWLSQRRKRAAGEP